MALEAGGVPAVAVHAGVFAQVARSVAEMSGMPTLRQTFVPQPVVGRSAAHLRGYIEGNDPLSNRPY